jgi:hypothetical protein
MNFFTFFGAKSTGGVSCDTPPDWHIPTCWDQLHLALADLAHAVDLQPVALDAKVEPPRQPT